MMTWDEKLPATFSTHIQRSEMMCGMNGMMVSEMTMSGMMTSSMDAEMRDYEVQDDYIWDND